jgi:uroporphyrinogen III methyltransferase / synthase
MSDTVTVYLVGAGPGDPGLLTLRAKECLEKADVVIYDYLATPTALRFARPDARRIFVGKKGFSAHVTQDEINACLIAEALKGDGRIIVRLKGGDPFVFGRGGEEALALRELGIAFEVVPGVTAGVAAPAYAGIPVTHRGLAASVAFITGHETPERNASMIDWEHLAVGCDTLCFYMGIRNLPLITTKLRENGRADDTPVALVRWGTTMRQETLVSTLAEVVQAAAAANFQAPAIIVVGSVVALRAQLAWFEDRPLFGRSVVVTRSREQASVLSERLWDHGGEAIEFPTIALRPRRLYPALRQAFEKLGTYDWVVFTSVNGVNCFFDLLFESGHDARALAGAHVAVIGSATAEALRARGVSADLVPERFVAEAVAESLLSQGLEAGARILVPRAAAARDALPNLLREAGMQVDVVSVYDTVIPDVGAQVDELVERLRAGSIDAVTFTSSSTVNNFFELLSQSISEDERARLLAPVMFASIGPVTSDTIQRQGFKVGVEADTYTIPGLITALETTFSRKESER